MEAIRTIEEFTAGKTFKYFTKNKLLQDGVLHELQIIGEASKRLSPASKSRYDLPWADIAGTRNKIVHDYFKVNLQIVWKTIKDDLPILRLVLKSPRKSKRKK